MSQPDFQAKCPKRRLHHMLQQRALGQPVDAILPPPLPPPRSTMGRPRLDNEGRPEEEEEEEEEGAPPGMELLGAFAEGLREMARNLGAGLWRGPFH